MGQSSLLAASVVYHIVNVTVAHKWAALCRFKHEDVLTWLGKMREQSVVKSTWSYRTFFSKNNIEITSKQVSERSLLKNDKSFHKIPGSMIGL